MRRVNCFVDFVQFSLGMIRRRRSESDTSLRGRKPGSPWPRPVSLAPFGRREIKCHHGRSESILWCGSAEGAVVRLAAGRLRASSCCREPSRSSFRWNVFPTVWPSGALTSRPAIRVNSESLPGPPTRVLSVTAIKSENERAQPINRPWRPRNCTGRAPFSEKFFGDSKGAFEPAVGAANADVYRRRVHNHGDLTDGASGNAPMAASGFTCFGEGFLTTFGYGRARICFYN